MYGGKEVYIHPFFVSALVTGERSAPFLDRFTSGKINCSRLRMVAFVVHRATGTGRWERKKSVVFVGIQTSNHPALSLVTKPT
jgi:hypothetical protein